MKNARMYVFVSYVCLNGVARDFFTPFLFLFFCPYQNMICKNRLSIEQLKKYQSTVQHSTIVMSLVWGSPELMLRSVKLHSFEHYIAPRRS
jgi:hypothetical protein